MTNGWQRKKLSEVCVLDKHQGVHKNLVYVGLENIESHTASLIHSVEPLKVKSSTFKFTSEHLLYGRLRPYLNKVLLPDFSGHCSTEIFPIKPHPELSREFLKYWFLRDATVEQINATSTGARMPRANMNAVLNFEFLLPSFPEQQRIVAILDEAFKGIATAKANTEKNLQNAREIFENHLNKVFTQRGEEWVEKTIGDIARVKGGKRIPKGDKLLTVTTEFPYLRVTDFNSSGSIDISDLRYVNAEVHRKIKNYVIFSNDLYISIAGTIGKSGIIPKELDGANLTENACRLIFNPGINNRFIYYFTTTPDFIAQAGVNTRTTTQPKLALSRLSTIKLGIPPLEIQNHLVSKFDTFQRDIKHLESIYERKLASLEALKKSLLNQAFTGNL